MTIVIFSGTFTLLFLSKLGKHVELSLYFIEKLKQAES
jgi:hypothetical protein